MHITHHDGTTQQIDDCCGNYETDNATFLRKSQALHQCRVKEDEAWKKTINVMMDLLPSDELTALYTQLKGFELCPS